MARLSVRSTYSLDVDTVRALEDVSRRWSVSKSEALRRAIRAAAGQGSLAGGPAIEALDQLQRSLKASQDDVARWAGRLRRERRAASARRERRAG